MDQTDVLEDMMSRDFRQLAEGRMRVEIPQVLSQNCYDEAEVGLRQSSCDSDCPSSDAVKEDAELELILDILDRELARAGQLPSVIAARPHPPTIHLSQPGQLAA